MSASADHVLTDAQRAAVEWPTGPLMVLAGAGTGKTTVVVERVRHLLERDPTLAPENILVLTYNVKAAGELVERLERSLGVERAGRLWVHNFHSFGYRLLREHRTEAGLAPDAPLLDQVGQRLLLRDLRPCFRHFMYHRVATNATGVMGGFADMISRAKDELVTPEEFARYVAARRTAFGLRHGIDAWEDAVESVRQREAERETWRVSLVRRALAHGDTEAARIADREARRKASGSERAVGWSQLDAEQKSLANGLKHTYLRDAEAADVLRLEEEAEAYATYQDELTRRGALDFGEQILRAIGMLMDHPNVLRGYQRQFRHVLVDEFQDANMAQVLLLELVGRGPDKPDDVVVVGDDDQSIYRFRGASYAAFSRFEERFGAPPPWDPGRAVRRVERIPLLDNRRSSANVLAAAGRLIEHNAARLKQGEPLRPTREAGVPVEVVIAADEQDEADVVVTRIREAFEALPEPRHWSDIAVLTRRHRDREVVVDRLRRAGIPHSVVGASGLFLRPEVRDLEAAVRVLADPTDSVSLARLLTSGPWRLDALELLRMRRLADFDDRPLFEALAAAPGITHLPESLRAKLDLLHACIGDLVPRATRDGPHTLLEEYVARTHLVHDLVATGTPDAQRQVLGIARFLRFAADHERAHRRDSLADFVAWLDLFLEVGGDLELDTPHSIAGHGVQLMTIFQAKGLEWQVVVVPRIVEGQFPDSRAERQLLPVELLRQLPPPQFEVDEERRLLYVAMTRARARLILTSIEQAASGRRLRPSRFIGEVCPAVDGPDLPEDVVLERRVGGPSADVDESEPPQDGAAPADDERLAATLGRLLPVPAAFERRFALRRRAVEIVGLLEHLDPADAAGRQALTAELVHVATDAAGVADEERRLGLDPLTFRVVAGQASAGRSLLDLAPLPESFSHSQFRTYQECGLRYAFERIYRIPVAETKGFLAFGSAAHAAFETWVRQRRDAQAVGQPLPGYEALRTAFADVWQPDSYADTHEASAYLARSEPLLRRFYDRELASVGQAVGIERDFVLELDARPDEPPVKLRGRIDRIDRHPDGSVEVIDYKTGQAKSQAAVDEDDQLTTYALAMARGAVLDETTGEPLPAPARLTLAFTEADLAVSTTRTPEQLEAHAEALVGLARRIRAGEFAAVPHYRRCGWCPYQRLCPSRWGITEG